jgi:hypothetical protein
VTGLVILGGIGNQPTNQINAVLKFLVSIFIPCSKTQGFLPFQSIFDRLKIYNYILPTIFGKKSEVESPYQNIVGA